jgi:primosomal protein N' (replication factor Y)
MAYRPPQLFADVAVRRQPYSNAPAVLSYYVPTSLQSVVTEGALVWVPLRNRRVQGIVLTLYSTPPAGAPEDHIRPIADLGDSEVCVSPHLLQLAYWLHTHYRAPLWDALNLMLPAGIDQEAQLTWRTTSQGAGADLGALPLAERGVLYYLRQHGETAEADLKGALRGTSGELHKLCLGLHERGLLARGMAVSPPNVRPKYERLARLCIPQTALKDVQSKLSRAPRQAEVLRTIAERTHAATSGKVEQPAVAAHDLPLDVLRRLEAHGYIQLVSREVLRNPLDDTPIQPDTPPELSPQQARVLEPIVDAVAHGHQAVFLLHGVTGSGKTELYLRAIACALQHGRQALVLVPEIALTAQLVRRFAARFGEQVVVLHSGLSLGERYDTWRRLRRGDAKIIVGSRSAVFAPLPELGLIIVDEEHEPSYKHEEGVRYHARDVALKLGSLTKSAVILGSATPSVESFRRARDGAYILLELPDRIARKPGSLGTQAIPLPPVRIVDMRVELQNGNRSIFSRALQHGLSEVLRNRQQALLFLNRRGTAAFVMCRDCGYVVGCPRCSTALSVHQASGFDVLRCHSCSHRELIPTVCPQCWSPRIRQFGVGTQRVVAEVEALLPHARVLRWDRDVTGRKGAHDRLLQTFLDHKADVVVGTQMIAKGLDLPLVTLVGVISADTGLYMPDFRAGERTFQLMAQVAGRAGRRDTGGQVIIQTYNPDHYALRAAAEHNYHLFYREEIAFRAEVRYPPFSQLVRFVTTGTNAKSVQTAASDLAARIQAALDQLKLPDAALIGPAPAFMERVRGRYRWHTLVRAADVQPLLDELGPLPGWIIDVDPVSML